MVIDERPRDEAVDVLEPTLQKKLLEYPGRWVAMTRADVLAVGDSLDEVSQAAAERGVSDPILYFVPRDGRASLFF